jgi:hypothetical protein
MMNIRLAAGEEEHGAELFIFARFHAFEGQEVL